MNCSEDILIGAHDTEHGFFVDPARKTDLSLRPSPCGYTDAAECDYKCLLQHEDGPIAKMGLFDYVSTHGVCRDPVTGLDHALILWSAGHYYKVEFWSVVPAGGGMKREYSEAWDESLRGSRHLLAGADNTCLWRERQKGREVFQRALSALRVGKEAALSLQEGETATLPVRDIPSEVVTQQLLALDAVQPKVALFGTAAYADEAGRAAWRVIQVAGTRRDEDALGVVLVADRRTGTWRALYDVISGGSKSRNFPAQSLVVTGDILTAELCTNCSFDGEYGCFEIDLATNRATRLDGAACWEMRERHNPAWFEYDSESEPEVRSGWKAETFDLRKELGVD